MHRWFFAGLLPLALLLMAAGTEHNPSNGTSGADSVDAEALADTVCSTVVSCAFNPNEAATEYVNLVDCTTDATLTNEDVYIVPVDVWASNLAINVDTAPVGAPNFWSVGLMDDGAATNLECDLFQSNTSCQDTGLTDAVIAALSDLVLEVAPTGTPTAGEMRVSFCLTHD